MRIFLDESGEFSWAKKQISLWCGLSTPDQELPALLKRFAEWKVMSVGHGNNEIKGHQLTDRQLESFCKMVLPARIHNIWITLVGADTARTQENHVRQLGEQASEMFRLGRELCLGAENKPIAEMYRKLSGWTRRRSASNILWLITLGEAIEQAMQHTVIRFYDAEYDSEFEDMEIMIDESFVRRDEHVDFWREWLRNDLMKRSRNQPLAVINEWSARNHPFHRKYLIEPGLLNLNDLFVNHTDFYDSKKVLGLQVADICANICYRNFGSDPDLLAYRALRHRVLGPAGRELTLLTVDERSLHNDDLAKHVRPFDMAEWREHARHARIESPSARTRK